VLKPLSLRGRFSLEPSQESAEARKSINAIMAATHMPWGETRVLTLQQVGELQKALRQLEGKLAERERAVTDLVARLADRERDLAEVEALVGAREKVIEAAKKNAQTPSLSKEEQSALELLKAELERQETSLKEQRAALKEREMFIEENETKLFEKMQVQQEQEVELEQKLDDLQAMEKRLKEREAVVDPAAAAALKAEKEGKKFDEFNE
jgi:chemotaxis protein histidine kinase CheA